MNHSMGPALQPDDHSRRTQAIEEYCSSETFIDDATAWVTDVDDLPIALRDHICAAYIDSSAFDGVIDDALDGECSWV